MQTSVERRRKGKGQRLSENTENEWAGLIQCKSATILGSKKTGFHVQRSNGPGIPSPPRLDCQKYPGRAKRAGKTKGMQRQGGCASVGHRPEEDRQHGEQPVDGLEARVNSPKRIIAAGQCLRCDGL